jgi:hypothetical protein
MSGTSVRADDQGYWTPPQVSEMITEAVLAMTIAFPLQRRAFYVSGRDVDYGGRHTYIQSICWTLCHQCPRGIFSLRKKNTRTAAMPASGRFKSVKEEVARQLSVF